jgi:hypothetical protein
MDEIVIRGMLKWPDVPAVYGWLSLDRRGTWMIKNVSGRFERIANAAVNDFIGRNYADDEQGRWYFQNGPQRVFVALDYTPWVYRLDDSGEGLLAHTGAAPGPVEALYLDEAGALLVQAGLGIGVLLDRDLPAFVEQLSDPGHRSAEDLLEQVARGRQMTAMLRGVSVRVASIRGADLPGTFGFVPRPAPPDGAPDCL